MAMKHTKQYYDNLRCQVLEMRGKGYSQKQVARHFGIARSTVKSYESNTGVSVRGKPTRLQRQESVAALLESGKSRDDISNALGLSPYTVDRYMQDLRRGLRYKAPPVIKIRPIEERPIETMLTPMDFKGRCFEDIRIKVRKGKHDASKEG